MKHLQKMLNVIISSIASRKMDQNFSTQHSSVHFYDDSGSTPNQAFFRSRRPFDELQASFITVYIIYLLVLAKAEQALSCLVLSHVSSHVSS